MGGDEQLSFGGGGEVTNDGGSRPKKGEGPQKRGPEGRGYEIEELEELKDRHRLDCGSEVEAR